jgi:predicted DNA-binding WGR domain protein
LQGCTGELGSFGRIWIAEFDAARFETGQACPGALGDQSPFLFRHGGVNVQHEAVDVAAELGDDETDLLRHQPADKGDLWREWGRRGSPGTLRYEIYEQEEAAASAVRRIVRRRLQHGYEERGHRIMLQDAVPAAAEALKQGVFAPAGT